MFDLSYVQKGARGTAIIPLESELLTERVIPITETITLETAVKVYMALHYLLKTDEPIIMPIYSSGGEVTAGKAIYDMMQGCKCEIHTSCIGKAASMAATLLAAGTKGHRTILPHGEVMIHEVLINEDTGKSKMLFESYGADISESYRLVLFVIQHCYMDRDTYSADNFIVMDAVIK